MKKVILVTGASSGIGAETVKNLLNKGHIVVAAARRTELMVPLLHIGADIMHLDLLDDNSILRLVEAIQQKYKRLDVLVNNAGYGLYGAVEDIPICEARRQFEVNLFALARLTQLVLPIMRKQGMGTIINISSIGGKMYMPLGAWYHATKHALEGWSDCLRLEAKPFGIRVVIVEPGIIRSEWSAISMNQAVVNSGNSDYGIYAKALSKQMQTLYSGKIPSPPNKIAHVIVRAIDAKRPRLRYVAGRFSTTSLLIRRFLPDRFIDWFLWFSVKIAIA
jgi:short-subunit dehydrogenase